MGKKKSPSIPNAPSFQADPNVGWSQDFLKGQSNYLINGLTGGGGLTGLMADTVSMNPEITRLTLEQLSNQLAPSYRTGRQDLVNTLEANNQLTGSTTASALGNYENDYLSQLTAAGAQAGIADINRALSNRVALYGTGLQAAQGVGQTGLSNQNQMNQFALQNYENQVASALLNQPPQRGGLMGALTGAIGGGISGFALTGNPIGAAVGAGIGGVSGGFGSPGTGGQMLGTGASLYGSRNNGGLNGLFGQIAPTTSGSASSVLGGESIQNILAGTPYSKYGFGLN